MLKTLAYNGGINPDTSLGTLPPGQLVSGKNVLLSGAGLSNRGAPFHWIDPASTGAGKPINSLFYWNDQNGTKEWLIMECVDVVGRSIYQMVNDQSATTATKISTTVINPFFQYEVLNGVLILSAISDSQYKWTGSGNMAALGATWTALNVTTNALRVVNNIFFLASGSNVYWSNVADPTTVTTSNFIPFRALDGDSISALSFIGNDLIIFKHFSIGVLSTQTQIISGTVTLGPLSTLNIGTGCAGASAVDRFPDGRIVFLGSNAHVYIFDGSTLVDISQQNYPHSSIQSLLTAAASTIANYVGGAFVRVVPMRHEVWVGINDLTNAPDYVIYDYLNNCWFQKPSTTTAFPIISAFVGTSSHNSNSSGFKTVGIGSTGAFDPTNALLTGDAGGHVWIEDCGIGSDQSGASPTTQIEFSIPVPADYRPNLNYFFTLPFKAGSAAFAVTYFVGKNGTYGSSKTFTPTGNWDRLKIPLVFSDPMTSQQIKITYLTGATIQFDPAYISGEGDQ